MGALCPTSLLSLLNLASHLSVCVCVVHNWGAMPFSSPRLPSASFLKVLNQVMVWDVGGSSVQIICDKPPANCYLKTVICLYRLCVCVYGVCVYVVYVICVHTHACVCMVCVMCVWCMWCVSVCVCVCKCKPG